MGVDRLKKYLVLALILLIVSSTIHCAAQKQAVKESDEAALRRRVQEYWNHKINGEWEKSYTYESPSFRKQTAQEVYVLQYKRSVIRWEEFELLELWTSGDEGYAKVKVKVRYLLPKFSKSPIEKVAEEQWVRDGGQWYHGQA